MDILSITSLCSQTISSIINLLPINNSLPFPYISICTLLASSYRYFFYTMLSIVVEPYSINRVLAADCLSLNRVKSSQQLKRFMQTTNHSLPPLQLAHLTSLPIYLSLLLYYELQIFLYTLQHVLRV